MLISMILLSIGCAVGGQLLLKAGMNQIGRIGRARRLRWRQGIRSVAAGLALYGLSAIIWLYVLSRVELSYAFPFLSLSYVAVLAGARWGLNERLGIHRLVGSALIVLGVLAVSIS